jgi:hypothetical protein
VLIATPEGTDVDLLKGKAFLEPLVASIGVKVKAWGPRNLIKTDHSSCFKKDTAKVSDVRLPQIRSFVNNRDSLLALRSKSGISGPRGGAGI